jgi:hypothetical protein
MFFARPYSKLKCKADVTRAIASQLQSTFVTGHHGVELHAQIRRRIHRMSCYLIDNVVGFNARLGRCATWNYRQDTGANEGGR